MSFLSLTYGCFLLLVTGIYWLLQRQQTRLWLLLSSSLLFYASLQPGNLPHLAAVLLVLVSLTVTNFILSHLIARQRHRESSQHFAHTSSKPVSEPDIPEAVRGFIVTRNSRGTWLLVLGIVVNVLCLLSFKYLPFGLTTWGELFEGSAALASANWLETHWIVPLGLSFFCFEGIAYLVDVYAGAPPAGQLLQFTTYKFFFPKLIAGPITRYHPFTRQLQQPQLPTVAWAVEGLWLIAVGAVKKGLLAEHLSIPADLIFTNAQRAGSSDLWLATLAYGLQLYCDFSGYVDIALGSALFLGLTLPKNFDFPYFSTSIADFWRRWHITLGDWLRNYLYFPLGGSRQGLPRTCMNLIIVMLIAGIWHGAAWGYLVWGGIHGVALAVHRLTTVVSYRFKGLQMSWQNGWGQLLAWFFTQLTVFLAWIPFRLPDLQDAAWVVTHLWGHAADAQFLQKIYVEALGFSPLSLMLLLGALVAGLAGTYFLQQHWQLQLNWPFKLLLVPLCFYSVWQFTPQEVLPYIYFDF